MRELETLTYFSIWNYPLTMDEIVNFSNSENYDTCKENLNVLINNKIIATYDNYYFLGTDENCVTRRIRGNQLAQKIIPEAKRKAKLISKFPFVVGVGISGSLSKNYADEKSDIDYFIITKSQRLWTCRMFLIAYKKLILRNNFKKFCVNYFIAESALELEEKNRFTATEINTLIPVFGKDVFENFFEKNTWVKDYFIADNKNIGETKFLKKNKLIRVFESILLTKIGHRIEKYFKKTTIKRWNKLFAHYNKDDFNLALKSTDTVSKRHELNYQKKVLNLLEQKMNEHKKNSIQV